MAGLTILRVVGNEDLVRIEREQAEKDLSARQNAPVMLGLVAYLKQCWDAARISRDPITDIMLTAMRQRNGEYEADKMQAIRSQGGSEVFMMITEVKCRAAESWLRDILLDSGSPPWSLAPTPIPDLSPKDSEELQLAFAERIMEVLQASGQAPSRTQLAELKEAVAQEFRFKILQAAQNRVERMQTRIEDQFTQGGWADAFNEFITDLVTFPAAFVKGPIVRRQRYLKWDGTTLQPGERIAPEYERVSPFNIYPEPGITRMQPFSGVTGPRATQAVATSMGDRPQ